MVTALAVVGALLVPTPAQAASTVGAGTWENTSSKIKYKGTWKTSKSKQDSGGSVRTLSSSGYAQLSFTTSGIRWITRTTSASGIAEVYVDGTKKATVDLYSATTKSQQLAYEVTGLPEKTHTIRIVRTGTKNAASSGKNIQLDAFVTPDVVAPAVPTGLQTKVTGDDVAISWAANGESDLQGYRVYRRDGTATTRTLVATTTATVRSVTDPGRLPGETDVYDVVAFDVSGNVSGYSTAASVTLPISTRDAGTYDNGDPAIGLRGAWTTVSSAADLGGSRASLRSDGYAQISFTTPGIRWLTRLDSSSGIADVYLDGVKKTSVDLYAANAKTQQVAYEAKGLPSGPHTLRVVWTGTKNAASSGTAVTVDAFVAPDVVAPAAPTGLTAVASGTDVVLTWARSTEPDLKAYQVWEREGSGPRTQVGTFDAGTTTTSVLARAQGSTYTYDLVAVDTSGNASGSSAVAVVIIPIKPEGAGTYENDSPEVTLNGSWSVIPSKLDSGGSYSSLDETGYAQVSFSTSGIRWISRVNNYSGIADVYLDGVKKTSVDLYSATTKFQQVVYEVKGLPETPHTLRIVRTGLKNPSSNSSQILLDAFLAPNVFPPAAPHDVAATPTAGGVQLQWTASPEGDVNGYRVYRGAATGALALVTSQADDDT
ncbi:MAG: hypothetical protein ACRYG2_28985, partial [Janthinobacterium lividum]